jgi:PKD repeat protein
VVSQAGVILTQHLLTNTGYMKISPDGKQLCQTHFPLFDPDVSNPNFVQLFDFDNTTGQVTNGRSVMFDNAMYVACEYSSDSKMLYLVRPYERKIDQLEATLPSAAAVSASTISISTTSPVLTLQLAPNEKIYTFRPGQSLGVINSPAVKGAGCNFQDNQLDISPFSARFGSPSFINDVAYDPNNSFSYVITDSCSGRVQFTAISGMPGTLTWSWNFGDGNTSTLQNPVHTFAPANQSYTVSLTISSSVSCGNKKQRIINQLVQLPC